MLRCKVALPSENIADAPTVFKCTAAGSILVLYWSSIMLYTLVQTSKRAAPELLESWISYLHALWPLGSLIPVL